MKILQSSIKTQHEPYEGLQSDQMNSYDMLAAYFVQVRLDYLVATEK